MYEQQLQQSGLSANQAAIYEALLKTGLTKAAQIIKTTGLKRGLVYKTLEELAKLGLAIKKDAPGKVSAFEPAHPKILKELIEKQEARIKNAAQALEAGLGQLISEFNLVSGKPGVRFYEGLDGIKAVLEDTLTSNPQKNLLVFSDAAGYATYLLDWNTEYYAPKRKRLQIYEKVIIPNTAKALEWLKGYKAVEVTEMLFVEANLFPFATEINIYNNKVSFITFSEKTHIGVIIDNKEIHDTFKSVFNLVWTTGRQQFKNLQPSWSPPFREPFVKQPSGQPHTSE